MLVTAGFLVFITRFLKYFWQVFVKINHFTHSADTCLSVTHQNPAWQVLKMLNKSVQAWCHFMPNQTHTHKCRNSSRAESLTCPGRCSRGAVWTRWSAGRPARSGPGRRSRRRSSAGGPAQWHQTASPTPTPASRRTPETRWSSWSWFSWRRKD